MTSVRRVGAAYAKSMRTACTQASASVSNVALTRWRSANRPSQASSYTGDLAHVVRFSGAMPSLVKVVEKAFGTLPVSPNLNPLGCEAHQSWTLLVRSRGCQLAYYSMPVIQSIFGNWDRALGSALLLSSCLSDIITEYYLANSFMSFSTSYLL
ncbi:hypothetical protein BGY98DRAFT_1100549 [Russula aff. rugulosa BPL654]|nr:hypothetical protein BGY98DRAFT_1100549 [Russula aff. rugulosa BPL654]